MNLHRINKITDFEMICVLWNNENCLSQSDQRKMYITASIYVKNS